MKDFWSFDIKTKVWKEISSNVSNQNGPGPRSCFPKFIDNQGHSMSYYQKKHCIYFFGRYVDIREEFESKSTPDFYCYDINLNEWNLLSQNTSAEGGPLLISGHQMFINEENDKLYIHGGRNIQNDFSGLYIFDLINYEWSFKKFDSF
jgi:muskelin